MKTQYYRASTASIGMALACALGLAACGEGEEQFPDQTVVTSLINVTQPGLKLKLNDRAAVDVAPGDRYVFLEPITANTNYKVELVPNAIPPNAISCEVLRGTGNIGIQSPLDMVVLCKLYTYKLNGTIKGNFTGDMVINNGSATTTVKAGATGFELAPVPEGIPYSVTILKKPDTGNCSVSPARPAVAEAPGTPAQDAYTAPVGIMPKADVLNLNITCS